MKAYISCALAFIVISVCAEPTLAWEPYHTGLRTVSEWVNFTADADAGYTMTFNYSDPNNTRLFNYNQTVEPFQNETGIEGIFTGPFMPPYLVNVKNTTSMIVRAQGLTRFQSKQVMSGSSYSWWRIPFENPFSDSVTLRLWHVKNAGFLNWSGSTTFPNPVPITHPVLVFNQTYNLKENDGLNRSFYWYNHTSDWNFSHHWAWVKVVSPIHTDEHYAFQWVLGSIDNISVYYSLNDIGDDTIQHSWIYASGMSGIEGEIDLDCSVIHQYGMGYSVSGFRIDTLVDWSRIYFYSQLSRPVVKGEYITFLMPFIKDITTDYNAYVSIKNINNSWNDGWWIAENGPTDFTVHSTLWNEDYTEDLFYINITFYNRTNDIFIYDPAAIFNLTFEDDSVYSTHKFRLYNNPYFPDGSYLYFRPYHALQATNGSWENVWIDPVFILDGHVIDYWGILETLDVSEFYPWKVVFVSRLTNKISEVYMYFTNGGEFADWLRSNLGIDGIGDGQIVDMIGRIAEAFGDVVCAIGAFFCVLMEALADNASWVFMMLFHGLNIIIFIPVFLWLVLLVNGIKRWFVICVKDGPVAAVRYGQEFFRNSVKMAHQLPIVKIAERAGPAIKRAI